MYMVVQIIFYAESSDCLILAANFSIQMFIIVLFKLIHHESRPFWALENTTFCFSQFGNPSGHCLNSAFFAMYLYDRYFCKLTTIDKEWQKMPAFVVLSSTYVLMAFATINLGILTANQVIYGIILGLWTSIFCLKSIEPAIEAYISSF